MKKNSFTLNIYNISNLRKLLSVNNIIIITTGARYQTYDRLSVIL